MSLCVASKEIEGRKQEKIIVFKEINTWLKVIPWLRNKFFQEL